MILICRVTLSWATKHLRIHLFSHLLWLEHITLVVSHLHLRLVRWNWLELRHEIHHILRSKHLRHLLLRHERWRLVLLLWMLSYRLHQLRLLIHVWLEWLRRGHVHSLHGHSLRRELEVRINRARSLAKVRLERKRLRLESLVLIQYWSFKSIKRLSCAWNRSRLIIKGKTFFHNLFIWMLTID